jgi:hypothetical protein
MLFSSKKALLLNFKFFFVANTFRIQPFHKGLAIQADGPTHVLSKVIHNFIRGKKYQKNLPKLNNRTMGEFRPILSHFSS